LFFVRGSLITTAAPLKQIIFTVPIVFSHVLRICCIVVHSSGQTFWAFVIVEKLDTVLVRLNVAVVESLKFGLRQNHLPCLKVSGHQRNERTNPDDRKAEMNDATGWCPDAQFFSQRNEQQKQKRQEANRNYRVADGFECEIRWHRVWPFSEGSFATFLL
jgi:hypothetical protein